MKNLLDKRRQGNPIQQVVNHHFLFF